MCSHKPKAAAIKQTRDQPASTVELRQYRPLLRRAQHHGKALRPRRTRHVLEPGQLHIEHVAIKKEQSLQRLILSSRTDLGVNRQMTQEGLDLRRPHVTRMPAAMKLHIAPNPVQIGLFRSKRQMASTNLFPHDLE